jgi:hypothetical protein
MKLSRFSLSSLGLMSLLLMSCLSWGDKIPRKQPSDYGNQTSQVALTTPGFTTINQDGVTLGLNSVFCNSCTPGDINNTTNLEYFFDITLSSGSALTSLTFGPGFDTSSLQAYGVVQFDSTIPTDPCNVGGIYSCQIPISANTSNFETVATSTTFSCDAAGICTLTFDHFDFATLGGKTIVFAATTPFGVLSALHNPDNGEPLTPSVTVNGKSVQVPEPGSLWFAGIAGLICFGLIVRRQRMLPSTTTC